MLFSIYSLAWLAWGSKKGFFMPHITKCGGPLLQVRQTKGLVTGEGALANSQTTSPPLLGDFAKWMTWQLGNACPSHRHCLLAQKRRLTMCPVDNATQHQQNRPGTAVLGDVSLYGVKGWCCSFAAQWWEVETESFKVYVFTCECISVYDPMQCRATVPGHQI